MEFVVDRDPLIDAVNWVARSLSARPVISALLGIKIEVGTEITLSGTNHETSTTAVLPADIAKKGTVLVKGQLLAEIVRSLPSQPIKFSYDEANSNESRVIVTAGSARFVLPTIESFEYPTLPTVPSTTGTILGDDFAKAVAQVAVAAGRDDSIPQNTGVNITINKTHITFAATDRYRLAVKNLDWKPNNSDIETSVLVRARTLQDAAKSITPGSNLTLALPAPDSKESMIGFVSNSKTMVSRTMGDKFPSFNHLIPTEFKAEAVIDVGLLLDAVRRIALVADKTQPIIFTFNEGGLKLEAGGAQDAQASEAIEMDYTGEEMRTGYNPSYLIDGLQAISGTYVHFGLTAYNKLAVLTGKSEATSDRDTSYMYLLNPMRL